MSTGKMAVIGILLALGSSFGYMGYIMLTAWMAGERFIAPEPAGGGRHDPGDPALPNHLPQPGPAPAK